MRCRRWKHFYLNQEELRAKNRVPCGTPDLTCDPRWMGAMHDHAVRKFLNQSRSIKYHWKAIVGEVQLRMLLIRSNEIQQCLSASFWSVSDFSQLITTYGNSTALPLYRSTALPLYRSTNLLCWISHTALPIHFAGFLKFCLYCAFPLQKKLGMSYCTYSFLCDCATLAASRMFVVAVFTCFIFSLR